MTDISKDASVQKIFDEITAVETIKRDHVTAKAYVKVIVEVRQKYYAKQNEDEAKVVANAEASLKNLDIR